MGRKISYFLNVLHIYLHISCVNTNKQTPANKQKSKTQNKAMVQTEMNFQDRELEPLDKNQGIYHWGYP